MSAGAGEQSATMSLFREYAALEKLRNGTGVTPLEYQRWLDLRDQLESRLQRKPDDQREFERSATRMKIEFKTSDSLQRAVIRNLSRGGVFVSTPFAAEVGTQLVLLLQIRSTGEQVELPCVVVTNNVADGFSTQRMGMGVRFDRLTSEQQSWVDELYAAASVEGEEEAAP